MKRPLVVYRVKCLRSVEKEAEFLDLFLDTFEEELIDLFCVVHTVLTPQETFLGGVDERGNRTTRGGVVGRDTRISPTGPEFNSRCWRDDYVPSIGRCSVFGICHVLERVCGSIGDNSERLRTHLGARKNLKRFSSAPAKPTKPVSGFARPCHKFHILGNA